MHMTGILFGINCRLLRERDEEKKQSKVVYAKHCTNFWRNCILYYMTDAHMAPVCRVTNQRMRCRGVKRREKREEREMCKMKHEWRDNMVIHGQRCCTLLVVCVLS